MMGCVSFLPSLFEGKGAGGSTVRRLTEDQSGVTAIEYGLIAAVVIMGTVGTNLSGVFSQVASSL